MTVLVIQARKLRQQFESNKGLTDLNQIDRVIAAGEAELTARRHPDPYKRPNAFQR